MTTANTRTADHPIDPLFLERWSPRAFDGQPLADADIQSLFEAARWAPSSYNSQPWRFLYAKRDTPEWDKFLNLLIPFNQSWAKNASLLIIVVSNSLMQPPGQEKPFPSHSHSFDTGAAWANFALQATRLGLQAHGMAGFDLNAAFTQLNVPEGYRVEAAIAVGRQADKSILPEAMQAREQPSGRNPISSFAFEGGFPT
jgi:nitroreductase